MRGIPFVLAFIAIACSVFGQGSFPYSIEIIPLEIPGIVGLHSYAFGESGGKILVIGGRRDGLHARQPFSAFSATMNNDAMIVIDPQAFQTWTVSLSTLPVGMQEQLQSTNSCFHQVGDTLYIAGGYAYSATQGNHVTFPNLIAMHVGDAIEQVISGNLSSTVFRQLTDDFFAVTGGRMAHNGESFMIVGGHRFDGSYNPMGMPTYTQAYTNAVKMFRVIQAPNEFVAYAQSAITDDFHLHRRDFNLIPYMTSAGVERYYISSGVFQPTIDLPFLYPVEIDVDSVHAQTDFNQYLSNYHCPTMSFYDGSTSYAVFFGGMSQYYYSGGELIQDNLVPFTRTVSMVSRATNGNYSEAVLPIEMPGLKGSGAEFIPNANLPLTSNGMIVLSGMGTDTLDAGFIYGGIASSALNPFSSNQTTLTNADPVFYRVRLIRSPMMIEQLSPSITKQQFDIYPNPAYEIIHLKLSEDIVQGQYYLLSCDGKLLHSGNLSSLKREAGGYVYELPSDVGDELLEMIVVADAKQVLSSKFLKK